MATLSAGSHFGVETTRHYHEVVADLAVSAGMVVDVLNPRDTRHYRLGMGRRSKTDQVDTGMIRRLIQAEHGPLGRVRSAYLLKSLALKIPPTE